MTPDEARAIIAGRDQRSTVMRQVRTPEEAALRARCASKAQSNAVVGLRRLHKDDYDVLYQTALADLLAAEGIA